VCGLAHFAPRPGTTTAPLGAHEGEVMQLMQMKRASLRLLVGSVLLLATGCGGGDKGPTGPGGGGIDGEYELMSLGHVELPADLQIEDCILTRFYDGGLRLYEDGTWQQALEFYDDNYGDATARDQGEYEQEGSTVWLTSEYSGATHEATLDGTEVKIMYDWCYNGVPDVQLVFDR
jgi:hypothetical protein